VRHAERVGRLLATRRKFWAPGARDPGCKNVVFSVDQLRFKHTRH